jgi:hypothetical protein
MGDRPHGPCQLREAVTRLPAPEELRQLHDFAARCEIAENQAEWLRGENERLRKHAQRLYRIAFFSMAGLYFAGALAAFLALRLYRLEL